MTPTPLEQEIAALREERDSLRAQLREVEQQLEAKIQGKERRFAEGQRVCVKAPGRPWIARVSFYTRHKVQVVRDEPGHPRDGDIARVPEALLEDATPACAPALKIDLGPFLKQRAQV